MEADTAESQFKKEKKKLAFFDKEIAKFETEKKTRKQELENAHLESQQLKHELSTIENEYSGAKMQIQSLLDSYPWIPDQEQ